MTGLILVMAIMAGTKAEEPLGYEQAYASASKTKKPMLILVGAEWCPACRVMKQETLPRLLRDGKLGGVNYTVVDIDRMPQLSSQLMKSTTIPQLILWTPLADGWERTYLQGSQAPESIVSMVRTGLEEQRRELASSEKNRSSGEVTADE